MIHVFLFSFFFFFNDTATTEIYTLSLHDALPIFQRQWARPTLDAHGFWGGFMGEGVKTVIPAQATAKVSMRSEEHTSELQSQSNLVCRLLLEKKKKKKIEKG